MTQGELRLEHEAAEAAPLTEAEKRDRALAAIAKWRASAITLGTAAALHIMSAKGRVTSVEVVAQLRAQGHGAMLDSIDARWIGAVFRGGGWKRIGWEATGSHARPVAVWAKTNTEVR